MRMLSLLHVLGAPAASTARVAEMRTRNHSVPTGVRGGRVLMRCWFTPPWRQYWFTIHVHDVPGSVPLNCSISYDACCGPPPLLLVQPTAPQPLARLPLQSDTTCTSTLGRGASL